jgi:hypothetical protein
MRSFAPRLATRRAVKRKLRNMVLVGERCRLGEKMDLNRMLGDEEGKLRKDVHPRPSSRSTNRKHRHDVYYEPPLLMREQTHEADEHDAGREEGADVFVDGESEDGEGEAGEEEFGEVN